VKRTVRGAMVIAGLGVCALILAGCQAPAAPPPQNVPVQNPPPGLPAVYPADVAKPMPEPTAEPPPPEFNDVPLVDQRLPEEAWFVNIYNHVGRPRIAVFVNRTLDGSLVGGGDMPVSTTETVRRSTGGVEVQHSEGGGSSDLYHSEHQHQSESFKSTGPAEYHETTTVYLHPGQYDEAALQALDYTEIESLLSDWLHSGGQVTLISPGFIRSHLTDQQVQDVQAGKASGLDAVVGAAQPDVFIQVQAHPTKRQDQLVVLLIAEAINIRGGESLAHASVEMPTPVDRIELNNYTRFLARKLMHEMGGTWSSAPPPAPPGAPAAPPTAPPAALPATRP